MSSLFIYLILLSILIYYFSEILIVMFSVNWFFVLCSFKKILMKFYNECVIFRELFI